MYHLNICSNFYKYINNKLLDVALKYLFVLKFLFQAYGEDNFETLKTMGEALEKKDTGDTARWVEEM